MNILFYGNCQMWALRCISNFNNIPNYNTKGIMCFNTKISCSDFINEINNSDIIIMSYITDNYRNREYLSTSFIINNAKKETKIFIIPSLRFDYYYFDTGYMVPNLDNPSDYHYKKLIDNFKNKLSIDYFIDNYINNEDLLSFDELDNLAKLSLDRLIEKENKINKFINNNVISIPVSQYINDNYKKILLFYSINHPSKYIFHHIIEIIYNNLQLSLNNINYEICPLNHTKCILYKCLQKHVNFDITIHKPCLLKFQNISDINMILKQYYDSYSKIDNLNHYKIY